jgi:hypothetical protein
MFDISKTAESQNIAVGKRESAKLAAESRQITSAMSSPLKCS